jgi:hypothetical protein
VLGEALDYLEKLWSDWILFKSFKELWSAWRGFILFVGKALD